MAVGDRHSTSAPFHPLTMDLIATFESHLRNAATALVADGVLRAVPERVIVEPVRDEGRGDLTSMLALAAGGSAGIEPRLLAEKIAERLRHNPDFAAMAEAIGIRGMLWMGI